MGTFRNHPISCLNCLGKKTDPRDTESHRVNLWHGFILIPVSLTISISQCNCFLSPRYILKASISQVAAAAPAKSLQSCPTLCDPRDSSPPGSPIPGILQARALEWVAISFSNAWKWKVKVKSLCRVRLLVTPWTATHQAPPSIGFSRQQYWSGVTLPSLISQVRIH